ncbi:MAG: diaminopimelate epimerase [Proteobacteria bacterium]|nr:diaminopimelate epimerase [Pseudomonadota bacterium]
MSLHFTKMHGIGNDFVVLDCRARPFALSAGQIARMADRHVGIGFDQLLTVEPARDTSCLFYYGIYNADGSISGQCGNGVRCVAAWLRRAGALGAGAARLESPSGPVGVELLDDGRVRVDMGEPCFDPARIPLALPAAETYATVIDGEHIEFGAVSMGNPHAVIEAADVTAAPLVAFGATLSTSALFPQSCNVGVVQIVDRAQVRLRVRERGVGETLACGTGACAAVAVLRRRGRLDERVAVDLPGGRLQIHWHGPGHTLWMTGPAEFVYEGTWNE